METQEKVVDQYETRLTSGIATKDSLYNKKHQAYATVESLKRRSILIANERREFSQS